MRTLERIFLIPVVLYAVFVSIVLIMGLLNHFGLFHINSIFVGFDYLPPLWLFVLALPLCFTFWLLKRQRTALLFFFPVLSFLLAFGDLSWRFLTFTPPEEEQAYEKLEVLTYNVRYYSYGLEEIVDFFKESGADVILLCESVLSNNEQRYIEKNLSDYYLISDQGRDTAVLSRYPIMRFTITPLPSYLASLSGSNNLEELAQKNHYRSFVHAVIDVNGIAVNVLSLRLIAGRAKDKSIKENWKWGRYLLQAQEQEQNVILDYIDSLQGPVVFGGDLNAPPSARVIKNFRRIARDAYFSDHLFGNFTFRTDFPAMRLDYIFHSSDLIAVDSKIIKTRLSDHFPLKCKLLIPKSKTLALQ